MRPREVRSYEFDGVEVKRDAEESQGGRSSSGYRARAARADPGTRPRKGHWSNVSDYRHSVTFQQANNKNMSDWVTITCLRLQIQLKTHHAQ